MKKRIVLWVEEYFYTPNTTQKILSKLLLPLSWLYCLAGLLRYKMQRTEDLGLPVVSIGNLSVGGNGKTPLGIALAKKQKNSAIVLRGYGRSSSGLQVVCDAKSLLCSVEISGDEAMEYALKLPGSIVIVSEDRKAGIKRAKELGATTVFLDDGYGKHNIKKLDILIKSSTPNSYCLPSGPYRERLYRDKAVVEAVEGVEFRRVVKLRESKKSLVLVTAIAKASRLDRYLPALKGRYYFEDHHSFNKDELLKILSESGADALLVTYKDYVKIREFNLDVEIIELSIELESSFEKVVEKYIEDYYEN